MEGHGILPHISVPEQKLPALSFCEASPKHLEAWLQQLPMANIGESAKQLYHAIIEVNQLITSAAQRQAMLELLRPPIYYVCRELAKHFLNQSIVLPEKQRKIANLAQALQLHLASGYKHVVMEIAETVQDKTRKQLVIPIHRAITDLSHCILRSSQLYCQSPPNCWLEIHQLFTYAHQLKLIDQKVSDQQAIINNETSIEHAYKRVLLLGCSKTNQMRQNDIDDLFKAYEEWAEFADLDPHSAGQALFVVNPEKDAPPTYRSLVSSTLTRSAMGLDASMLVGKFTDYLAYLNKHKKSDPSILNMPTRLSDTLLTSLSQALGILTKRTFKRLESHDRVFLTVGLSATHFMCSDGEEFTTMLAREGDDKGPNADYYLEKNARKDVWNSSADASPIRDPRAGRTVDLNPIKYTGVVNAEKKVSYQQHIVPLINTSPGGYCIQWVGDVPGNVQAGELLGVREDERHPWSIAVIRWVRQIKQQGTQFGVELLAPSAKPCGVQLIHKTGENSEFLRGLLLPELAPIGQPMTLITPRLPFQTGHRVMINERGHESKVQLNRRLAATSSFSQFEIKTVGSINADAPPSPIRTKSSAEDDFDSLWPSL
ncbi:MAG: GTPase [Hahellaceae bacterium]|nr:GTPase [Hahellaceae bacterium]